jgi:hypothetical protein
MSEAWIVGNSTTGKGENPTSDRATSLDIVGMGSVYKFGKSKGGLSGKGRKSLFHGRLIKWDMGERLERVLAPID